MAVVGSFPFNSFLSGVLSCVGTAVLAGMPNISLLSIENILVCSEAETDFFFIILLVVCLRIQVNKENKEFKVWYLDRIFFIYFGRLYIRDK